MTLNDFNRRADALRERVLVDQNKRAFCSGGIELFWAKKMTRTPRTRISYVNEVVGKLALFCQNSDQNAAARLFCCSPLFSLGERETERPERNPAERHPA